MMTKWVENDYKLLLFREMNRNNEIKLFFFNTNQTTVWIS